jgi:hypothetical protein
LFPKVLKGPKEIQRPKYPVYIDEYNLNIEQIGKKKKKIGDPRISVCVE